MITIENVSITNMEAAIRGMRNPMNSWDKSDSFYCSKDNIPLCEKKNCPYFNTSFPCNVERGSDDYVIGPLDLRLARKLTVAGTDHRKFMRMITVTMDITTPNYVWSEIDTYKVGTVRNSCSFMHKGMQKDFDISDFSVYPKEIYDILMPLEKRVHKLTYPYETDEYMRISDDRGRTYRVYKNGRVIREEFSYVDTMGRSRIYLESPATVYQTNCGYYIVRTSGRGGIHIPLHRMVLSAWKPIDNADNYQVNHIDGNKGNNSLENLEWVTASENMQHAVDMGLYKNLSSLHCQYKKWKWQTSILPLHERSEFYTDLIDNHKSSFELGKKYSLSAKKVASLKTDMTASNHERLFYHAYMWEQIIEQLNTLREEYLDTHDDEIFQACRQLLPNGYNQKATLMLNYEVLANMYKSRKNHKLDEWRTFCEFIETLPYSELITGKVKNDG